VIHLLSFLVIRSLRSGFSWEGTAGADGVVPSCFGVVAGGLEVGESTGEGFVIVLSGTQL